MEDVLYSGLAVGGPMEGKTIEGRFPGGILFVDKPSNKAWLYDYYADSGRFLLRPVGYDALWNDMTEDQKLEVFSNTVMSGVDATRELDYESRIKAAESTNTEVRALPEKAGVV